MKNSELYQCLKEGVEICDMLDKDSVAVLDLSIAEVKSLAGPEAEGATITVLRNARRLLAMEWRHKEATENADWILADVQTRFPKAAVRVRRDNVVEVLLDGLPVEPKEIG